MRDGGATSVPTIILCDPQSRRRSRVAGVIESIGDIDLLEVGSLEQVDGGRLSVASLAAVALDELLPGRSPALLALGSLGKAGCRVFAYADTLAAWPIGLRCRPLLAGVREVLDSATPSFADDLRQRLNAVLAADRRWADEKSAVQQVMRGLGLVGESEAMLSIFRQALRIGPLSDLPILITGESGTGKELLASAIHALDPRRRMGPFVPVNCAAISPTLAESELFGHRRGSFTGADRDRKGLLRAAHGGVIFLDEVSELPPDLQVKLLRVLQQNRVLGVGEERETAVNFRVVAASNMLLSALVAQGLFRTDLFHRLNVFCLHISPLRERRADIAPLIRHFLDKHRGSTRASGVDATAEFIQALSESALSGNARQLENIVRAAMVGLVDGTRLSLADLPREILEELSEKGVDAGDPGDDALALGAEGRAERHRADVFASLIDRLPADGAGLAAAMDYCEQRLLHAAMRQSDGNQVRAAKLLGITPRTIYNKLHKQRLGI